MEPILFSSSASLPPSAHTVTSRCNSEVLTGSPPQTSRDSARTDRRPAVHQRGDQAGYRGHLRDRMALHQRPQRFGVAVLGVVGQDHGGTRGQAGQHLHPALEERDRGLCQPNVIGPRRVMPQLPIQPRRHRPMGAHRPLGLPRSIQR